MNESQRLRAWSLVVGGVVVTSILPLAAACGGSNNTPPTTAGAGTIGVGQPPPGYTAQAGTTALAGQGTAPPGYPGTPAATAPGYPQTGYPQPSQAGQTVPTAAPSGSTAPLAPTDPNSLQGILNGIQGALAGTLVPPGTLGGDPTEAGLKAHAAHVAPGMQPEGDELKQAMTEGQHSVVMFTLQAGKCYAIVGFSPAGGVKNLDLNLLAPPFYMTLAGQDLTHNASPVIGGAPNPMCPVIAFPLQYKLDVFAQAGSGPVAVQLYSKTK